MISPSSSRSPSPADESDLQDAHARLGKLLDLDGLIGPDTTNQDTQYQNTGTGPADDDEEQEFEFRLFSAPSKSADTAAKTQKESDKAGKANDKDVGDKKVESGGTQKLRIRLRSPTPVPGDGKFVKAFRGWEYYFSTPTLLGQPENEEQQTMKTRQFEDMALDGQQVMELAKAPWVSHSWNGSLCALTDVPPARLRLIMASHSSQTPPDQTSAQRHGSANICRRGRATFEITDIAEEARQEATRAAAQARGNRAESQGE